MEISANVAIATMVEHDKTPQNNKPPPNKQKYCLVHQNKRTRTTAPSHPFEWRALAKSRH
jgi:hypothetical protein